MENAHRFPHTNTEITRKGRHRPSFFCPFADICERYESSERLAYAYCMHSCARVKASIAALISCSRISSGRSRKETMAEGSPAYAAGGRRIVSIKARLGMCNIVFCDHSGWVLWLLTVNIVRTYINLTGFFFKPSTGLGATHLQSLSREQPA